MALTSARFTSSTRLARAANDNPPLRNGARGRGVHLLQFALIDRGFPMPGSTGRALSPDGVYGDETVEAVKAYQRSRRLPDSGEVGRSTMAALDADFRRPTNRVTLHFRSLSLTDVPFENALRNAQIVYGQYGIELRFGSGVSLGLSPEEAATFERIDDECNWDMTSGEYDQLHRLGPPTPATDIRVYFVNRMRDVLGCGGHAPNRPAATVARAAWRWDMGHEIGHVLLTSSFTGPVHHPHGRNLMNAYPANNGVIKVLTLAQVRRMRAHICCRGA